MVFALCFLPYFPALAFSAEPTYWQDIRPALRKHCTVCHSARNLREVEVSGGLALDSYAAIVKNPGKRLIEPGHSAKSLLAQLITTADTEKRMPLGGRPLPADVVALLRRWIDAGAKEGTKPETDVVTAPAVAPRRRRKLDIVLPTTAVPPAGLFGPAQPEALQLALCEGPLPPAAAVAFSPDGRLLASGAYGYAAVWDLRTGRPVKFLTNVLAAVNDLKFSPDGKLLAVAGGQPSAKGDLRLFQVDDWKLLATLGGHDDVVACVAFSPDGKYLASASFDRTVRVWGVADHKLERILTGHSDFVYSVAFSPDGELLASCGKDRSVKLVEAHTGKSRLTFSGMNQEVLAVAYRPDGQFIVSSGFESNLFWWNSRTGERSRLTGGPRVATTEICFSRDGKLLATSGMDGSVYVWNGATGMVVQSAPVGSIVYAVAMSGDGKRLAAGSADGLVRLWDIAGNGLLATFVAVVQRGVEPDWLVLSPAGYSVASDSVMKLGEWRMGKQKLPAPAVWKALGKPSALAQSLTAGMPAPAFGR